jgi:uncharacterized DUF497 family protein
MGRKERYALNKKNHGVSFTEAQTVFADENGLLLNDPDYSHDEDRFIPLGLSSNLRLLVIPHTYRKNDAIIRIISARKATRSEQQQYWNR